jgi:hypothetical protein
MVLPLASGEDLREDSITLYSGSMYKNDRSHGVRENTRERGGARLTFL